MCLCTPEIRTPYCGKGDCVWPGSKPENARESTDTIESAAKEFLAALDHAHKMDTQSTWTGIQLEKTAERHKAWLKVREARAKLESFL
jgi:hypothetical protein